MKHGYHQVSLPVINLNPAAKYLCLVHSIQISYFCFILSLARDLANDASKCECS